MKSVPVNLQSHLEEEVTTLATLWRVVRTDGVEFYFTDHDVDVEFEGNTYKASTGYSRTAVSNDSSLAVDNLEIDGLLDSDQISEGDLRAGLFDYAEVYVHIVNWQAPGDGSVKMRRGRLGEAKQLTSGAFQAELRGMTQLLSQKVGELFSAECRADLGDSRCKVPIQPDVAQRSTAYEVGDFVRVSTAAGTTQEQYENRIYECTTAGTTAASEPTYDTTVGNTTTDGTAVFTAREAWTRHAEVDAVTDRTTFTLTGLTESRAVDDWFNGGALAFESGDNDGVVVEVRDWVQSSSEITLFLGAPFDISSGDKVRLYPGCDKRLETCVNKFALAGTQEFSNGNAKNYRGEPFIPGSDFMFRTPDAQG